MLVAERARKAGGGIGVDIDGCMRYGLRETNETAAALLIFAI